MKRISLSPDERISTPASSFVIEKLHSRGGSCLVYDGYFLNSQNRQVHILIKEFYPASLGIARRANGRLEPEAASQKQFFAELSNFRKAFEVQSELFEKSALKNQISPVLELVEYNNTLYQITLPMRGQTLSELEKIPVKRAFEIVLSTARILKDLHELGYVYLDLKPDNVCLPERMNDQVQFFDFDTLYQSGTDNSLLPENPGFSCIEQRMGNEPDPSYDVYACSALLFRLLFDRNPEALDLVSWSKLDFSGLQSVVNEALEKELNAFFFSSLQNDPDLRWMSMDPFISSLERLLTLLEQSRLCLFSWQPVFGRRNCLYPQLLKEALDWLNNRQAGLLQIIGDQGSGRSQFLLDLAFKLWHQGNQVVLLNASSGMEQALADDGALHIYPLEREKRETKREYVSRKLNALRRLSENSPILILIDDFNPDISSLDLLKKTGSNKVQMVVVSHQPFEVPALKVLVLEKPALKDLQNTLNPSLDEQFCDYAGYSPSLIGMLQAWTQSLTKTDSAETGFKKADNKEADCRGVSSNNAGYAETDGIHEIKRRAQTDFSRTGRKIRSTKFSCFKPLRSSNELPLTAQNWKNLFEAVLEQLHPSDLELFCLIRLYPAGADRETVESLGFRAEQLNFLCEMHLLSYWNGQYRIPSILRFWKPDQKILQSLLNRILDHLELPYYNSDSRKKTKKNEPDYKSSRTALPLSGNQKSDSHKSDPACCSAASSETCFGKIAPGDLWPFENPRGRKRLSNSVFSFIMTFLQFLDNESLDFESSDHMLSGNEPLNPNRNTDFQIIPEFAACCAICTLMLPREEDASYLYLSSRLLPVLCNPDLSCRLYYGEVMIRNERHEFERSSYLIKKMEGLALNRADLRPRIEYVKSDYFDSYADGFYDENDQASKMVEKALKSSLSALKKTGAEKDYELNAKIHLSLTMVQIRKDRPSLRKAEKLLKKSADACHHHGVSAYSKAVLPMTCAWYYGDLLHDHQNASFFVEKARTAFANLVEPLDWIDFCLVPAANIFLNLGDDEKSFEYLKQALQICQSKSGIGCYDDKAEEILSHMREIAGLQSEPEKLQSFLKQIADFESSRSD